MAGLIGRAPIDKVGLALVRGGRLLLARSRGSEVFQIPGGKVEPGDASDEAALAREIREELGVALDPAAAVRLGVFSAPAAGQAGRMVEIKLYSAPVSGTPVPCGEIAELTWLDLPPGPDAPITAMVRTRIAPALGAMLARGQILAPPGSHARHGQRRAARPPSARRPRGQRRASARDPPACGRGVVRPGAARSPRPGAW